MNSSSVLHTPGPLDVCALNGQMHVRFRAERFTVLRAKLLYLCNKDEWYLRRDEAEMEIRFSDSEFEYFYASVPRTDIRFAYIFELSCADGCVRYLSEEGLTDTFDHSLAYFNYFECCAQFPCDMMTVPDWVRTAVGYQIFPERFAIGSHDKDMSYVNAEWGEIPTPKSFYGGDLVGITEHLPYLVELGVNFIYLNPIFCSPTNHKYETVDYENVDPEFGGNEALRDLINEAHKNGIRIMLDGVFNHLSWKHPFFLDAQKLGKASKYYDWFVWNPDGSYRTFSSVKAMPKLNTANPEVIKYFTDLCIDWMRDYGVDAWRLDVSDEISHRFLRAYRESLVREKPDVIIIGEDWHRQNWYLNGDEYDGVMNYGFTKACLDLFAFNTIDASAFRDRLVRLYHAFSIPASEKMLNLLDSHDTDRFLSRVKGDERKLRSAMAILFFYPGIPSVYYGDEIGLSGGYDPDCRRCFDWEHDYTATPLWKAIKELIELKKQPALSVGSFSINESDGVITIIRAAESQKLVLKVNPNNETRAGIPPYEYKIMEI